MEGCPNCRPSSDLYFEAHKEGEVLYTYQDILALITTFTDVLRQD